MNEYNTLQKEFFENTHHLMVIDNHQQHNQDPEYWEYLLHEVKYFPENWKGKSALDFGCGCGRNLVNLSTLAEWGRIDGCDISKKNAEYSAQWFGKNSLIKCDNLTWENNGYDLQPAKDETYDFVMSHIVFQHISNYSTRLNILKDIFRVLKSGGFTSLHFMDLSESCSYYESPQKFMNCRVGDANYLIKDFKSIGFSNIECIVGQDFFTKLSSYYIKGRK